MLYCDLHDEIQMEVTVMVGSDACGNSSKAFGGNSAKNSRSAAAIFSSANGFASAQLTLRGKV